jgi:hypothetical protein
MKFFVSGTYIFVWFTRSWCKKYFLIWTLNN